MKPRTPTPSALATTATLLAEITAAYTRSPALRAATGITLVDLEGVRKVRRQILKQIKQAQTK